MPDFGGIPMGESPTTSSTENRYVATDEALAQAIAHSMPGWSGPEQYDENRAWLTRWRAGRPEHSADDFEQALARMNETVDRVNAAALQQARDHVAAIRELIDLEIREVAAQTAFAISHGLDRQHQYSVSDIKALAYVAAGFGGPLSQERVASLKVGDGDAERLYLERVVEAAPAGATEAGR
jgi:hypothetical protein